MLGLGLAVNRVATKATGGDVPAPPGETFTPASLFDSNESGAWYDIQDISKLKSDLAGTTAASPGGPVGRIIDKSGNQNDAVAISTSQRKTMTSISPQPRHNWTLFSETNTSMAGGSLVQSTVSNSPLGTYAKVHEITSSANTVYRSWQESYPTGTTAATIHFYAKLTNSTGANPAKAVMLYSFADGDCIFNLDTGNATTSGSFTNASMTAVTGHSDWYHCVVTKTGSKNGIFEMMTDGTANFQATLTAGQKYEIQGTSFNVGTTALSYHIYNNSNDNSHQGVDPIISLIATNGRYTATIGSTNDASLFYVGQATGGITDSEPACLLRIGATTSDENSVRFCVHNSQSGNTYSGGTANEIALIDKKGFNTYHHDSGFDIVNNNSYLLMNRVRTSGTVVTNSRIRIDRPGTTTNQIETENTNTFNNQAMQTTVQIFSDPNNDKSITIDAYGLLFLDRAITSDEYDDLKDYYDTEIGVV